MMSDKAELNARAQRQKRARTPLQGRQIVQYLRIYVRAPRQKIELEPERPQHILTEQGVGYRLRAQD